MDKLTERETERVVFSPARLPQGKHVAPSTEHLSCTINNVHGPILARVCVPMERFCEVTYTYICAVLFSFLQSCQKSYNAGGTPVAGGFFASYSVVVYHWAYR